MKKALTMAIAVLLTLSMTLSGCAAVAETPAESVIGKVLVNAEQTFAATKSELTANAGNYFHVEEGNAELKAGDDGVVMTTGGDDRPMINLDKRLDDIGRQINGNQAFHIRFKSSQREFELMMSGGNNAGLAIGEDNGAVIYLSSGEYWTGLEGDARFAPDQWCHVLLGMGTDGVLQAAFWMEGEEDRVSKLNMPTGSRFGDTAYRNQSWMMSIGLRENANFTVDSYEYYTFDGFTELGSAREELEALVFDLVIASTLENAQTLWYEGSGGFAENQGGEFGGGAAKKQYNEKEGRLELISKADAACVPFNTTLRDCGPDHRQQQAILVRYRPEKAVNYRFSFEGTDEIALEFGFDGPKLFDMGKGTNMKFSEFAPNTFENINSSIYYLLFAVDDKAKMRVFVWEEGNIANNQAYLEYDLFNGNDKIFDCAWKMFVGFQANGKFDIYEYWVYTFDAFLDGSPFIASAK